MQPHQRLAALVALLLLPGASLDLRAQAPARSRAVGVAAGLASYSGSAGESGVGALLRLLAELRPADSRLGVRAEISAQRYTVLGQSCTTGVPGTCWPASPPDRVWSAGLHSSYRVGGAPGRLFVSGGLGVYGRSASAAGGLKTTGGGEAGLGLVLGRGKSTTMLLDARYVSIGTGRSRATVWPVSLGVLF